MLAPLFAGWMLGSNFSWRMIYRWDFILIAVFLLFVLMLEVPRFEERSRINFSLIPQVAFIGSLPWFYAAIAFYVSAELGMASWMVTFLHEDRGLSVAASSRFLSGFFALLMGGRFVGGFFVTRTGHLRSTMFAALGAIFCLASGLFAPVNYLFFLPLTGLFFSIIFPTLTASVSDLHFKNINTLLGLLFTFAGIGGVLGPWLVGWTSDMLDLQAGLSVNLIFTILLFISILILVKGRRDGKSS